MTRMCFDDLMQWLADVASRPQITNRTSQQDINLFSLPLEFMDQGCRVRPHHLPHLARIALTPKSSPYPSIILYRVRRWAHISGGIKDDERKAWMDGLRRIVGRDYAKRLAKIDLAPKEEWDRNHPLVAGTNGGALRRTSVSNALGSQGLLDVNRGRPVTGVSDTSSLRGLSPSTYPPSSPHNASTAAAMVTRKSFEASSNLGGRSPSKSRVVGEYFD
ncbi:hypothetical protein BC829DRAFT_124388 [Chytridium lagenaria]|nr:hypothetical protein BC829DRAFT_124388 [Chytridium lagenaria]